MTTSTRAPYVGHRFSPELISYTVSLYFRIPPSFRIAKAMLGFRGFEVSDERSAMG
jgi:transposase-like protein